MKSIYVVALSTLLAVIIAGCADAGPDKTVDSGAVVQLNGENSSPDRGGKIVKYLWLQKTADKIKVKLEGNPGKKPTFKAPYVKEKTKLHFKLRTYEYYSCKYIAQKPTSLPKGKVYYAEKREVCKVNISKDSVTITVLASNKKFPPTAVAEANKTEVKVAEVIVFTGEKSSDQNGEIISYLWKEGNTTLSEKASFEHHFATAGTHTVTLTVTDDEDLNATDSVTIHVGEEGSLKKPNALITVDHSKVHPLEAITFDGSNSTDQDGEITEYLWKDQNGTVLSKAEKFTTTFDQPGVYNITLTVTDDDTLSSSTTNTIKVVPEASLESIAISIKKQNLEVNQTTDLLAIGNYDDGSTKEISKNVKWIESNSTLAKIDSNGILTALAAGDLTIYAAEDNITSPTLSIIIKEP